MKADDFSRRGFLKVSAAAAGGLLLGFELPFGPGSTVPRRGEQVFDAWLHVGTDGRITVRCGQSEMGQGVYTSLPQLVAEELEVPWEWIRVEDAGAGEVYRRPGMFSQFTGGSTSVRGFFDPLRKVGAQARELLRKAAARRWGVAVEECRAERGRIHHDGSGRSVSYGEVADAARVLAVPEAPPLKDPEDWTLLGRSVPRTDTLAKVTGQAAFGVDTRLPGMLYAAVRQAPVFGAAARAHGDPDPTIPGVHGVHPVPGGLAVVAESWWSARRALADLEVEWTSTPHDGVTSASEAEGFVAALDAVEEEGLEAGAHGEVEAGLVGAAKVLEAEYRVPYLCHAPMEPQSCVADVRRDGVDLYAGTQAQEIARDTAAQVAGVPPDRVTVHTTFLGGGFGRRFETDVVVQAVTLSKAVGRPVKVVWTREEDMRHDFYRPRAMSRFRVGLDGEGLPVAWDNAVASPSILARVFPMAVKLRGGLDDTSTEGAKELPYALPHFRCRYVPHATHVPVGFWRSVGSSQNAFFTECMLDEVAHAGGHDPVELRRRLLRDTPRHLRVLEELAEACGWAAGPPPGRHRGVAVHESFGTVVGEVAEISVEDGGGVRVHTVWCVADPGRVVNPGIFSAQMESGIVYGLTAALKGEITLEDGAVAQGNFDDYPMLRMGEMPVIHVRILETGAEMGGAGEPATPPIAPAVANALFAATGERRRTLPLLPPERRL